MSTHVTETPAASSDIALRHFQDMLAFETDCWDVHESLKAGKVDFVIVDVRDRNAFAKGYVKGAINIPHREMTAERMSQYPNGKLFVVYCAGPHCNGADKAGCPARAPLVAGEDDDRRRDWVARRGFHADDLDVTPDRPRHTG